MGRAAGGAENTCADASGGATRQRGQWEAPWEARQTLMPGAKHTSLWYRASQDALDPHGDPLAGRRLTAAATCPPLAVFKGGAELVCDEQDAARFRSDVWAWTRYLVRPCASYMSQSQCTVQLADHPDRWRQPRRTQALIWCARATRRRARLATWVVKDQSS